MHEDFWHGDSNLSDDGATPLRPTRCASWAAPDDFPSADRPYVWSGQ